MARRKTTLELGLAICGGLVVWTAVWEGSAGRKDAGRTAVSPDAAMRKRNTISAPCITTANTWVRVTPKPSAGIADRPARIAREPNTPSATAMATAWECPGMIPKPPVGRAKQPTRGMRWRSANSRPCTIAAREYPGIISRLIAGTGRPRMKVRLPARNGVAYLFACGDGVQQDQSEAVRWWRKAAENGDTTALLRVGQAYERGEGVTQDYAEAMRWYRKAAEQWDTAAEVAELFLARAYRTGQGVARDYVQAGCWYLKLAGRFGAHSSRRLGWSGLISLMMLVTVLVVPKRRWGRAAAWGPWGVMAGSSAMYLYHCATSGTTCTGPWDTFLVAGLGGISVISAVTEFITTTRGEGSRV